MYERTTLFRAFLRDKFAVNIEKWQNLITLEKRTKKQEQKGEKSYFYSSSGGNEGIYSSSEVKNPQTASFFDIFSYRTVKLVIILLIQKRYSVQGARRVQ